MKGFISIFINLLIIQYYIQNIRGQIVTEVIACETITTCVSDGSIILNASARVVNNDIEVAQMSGNQEGSAWWSEKVAITEGFSTTWTTSQFRGNNNQGDGQSFMIHNLSQGTAFVSGVSGYLGFLETLSGTNEPFFAIEFDQKNNGASAPYEDPNNNHISVWLGGSKIADATPTFSLRSNNVERNWELIYSAVSKTITLKHTNNDEVIFDNLSVDLSSIELIDDIYAVVGFTGSSGSGSNEEALQRVHSWSFSSFACETNDGKGNCVNGECKGLNECICNEGFDGELCDNPTTISATFEKLFANVLQNPLLIGAAAGIALLVILIGVVFYRSSSSSAKRFEIPENSIDDTAYLSNSGAGASKTIYVDQTPIPNTNGNGKDGGGFYSVGEQDLDSLPSMPTTMPSSTPQRKGSGGTKSKKGRSGSRTRKGSGSKRKGSTHSSSGGGNNKRFSARKSATKSLGLYKSVTDSVLDDMAGKDSVVEARIHKDKKKKNKQKPTGTPTVIGANGTRISDATGASLFTFADGDGKKTKKGNSASEIKKMRPTLGLTFVAIIFGCSSGVGAACVEALAKKGIQDTVIVLAARRVEKMKDVVEVCKKHNEVRSGSVRFEVIGCDATKEDEVRSVYQTARLKFGGTINCVINSVGGGCAAKVSELSYEKFQEVNRINIDSAFLITKYYDEHLLENKKSKGHLIGVSSVCANTAEGGFSLYCSAKTWFTIFHASYADEARDYCKVDWIEPYRIDTEFFNVYEEDKRPSSNEMLPSSYMADAIMALLFSGPFSLSYYYIVLRNWGTRIWRGGLKFTANLFVWRWTKGMSMRIFPFQYKVLKDYEPFK